MQTRSPGQLTRSAAYFPVPDVELAASHYTNILGFSVEYTAGNPAEFAIVSRDGLPIMLRRVGLALTPNEAQGGTWDLFFWVRDARALHSELAASGAEVVYAPTMTPYDTIEFAVRDLNGYVLGFGQEKGSE